MPGHVKATILNFGQNEKFAGEETSYTYDSYEAPIPLPLPPMMVQTEMSTHRY